MVVNHVRTNAWLMEDPAISLEDRTNPFYVYVLVGWIKYRTRTLSETGNSITPMHSFTLTINRIKEQSNKVYRVKHSRHIKPRVNRLLVQKRAPNICDITDVLKCSLMTDSRSTLYIPALTLSFSSLFFDSFSTTLLYSRRGNFQTKISKKFTKIEIIWGFLDHSLDCLMNV